MMKTTHFERITTRPVTVQQEVREVVEVPTITFNGDTVVELLEGGTGGVLVNGVLWENAKMLRYTNRRSTMYGYPFGDWFTEMVIQLPHGTVTLDRCRVLLNQTASPRDVGWKQKVEQPCFDCAQSLGYKCGYHQVTP